MPGGKGGVAGIRQRCVESRLQRRVMQNTDCGGWRGEPAPFLAKMMRQKLEGLVTTDES
jgi:hypothetical protein